MLHRARPDPLKIVDAEGLREDPGKHVRELCSAHRYVRTGRGQDRHFGTAFAQVPIQHRRQKACAGIEGGCSPGGGSNTRFNSPS